MVAPYCCVAIAWVRNPSSLFALPSLRKLRSLLTISLKLRSSLPYSTTTPSELGCVTGTSKLGFAKNLANLMEEESSTYSTHRVVRDVNADDKGTGKLKLAEGLASLVQESHDVNEQKPNTRTRVEMKRFLENRIKKKVKEQYRDGKYHNLMMKVIADPNTLKDAYDCIRVSSNVDLASDGDKLSFESIAEDLRNRSFDIGANTYSIKAKGAKADKEVLFLPNLMLMVVVEAIRIVLEVVYRPHFSKISHGLRSGRSHLSALKYIRKEIPNPDWWFTLLVNQKLNEPILNKLLSLINDKIDDPDMFDTIKTMFDVGVLNMEFGGFPKGHGLPQEGALSPILMNVYLDLCDREVYRMSMQYENFSNVRDESNDRSHSKLRGWFRRQINGVSEEQDNGGNKSGVRIHCCRFMDEIFFAVSGPKEVALAFKSEIESYLRNSLFLNTDDDKTEPLSSCIDDRRGVRFLGMSIKRREKENTAVRAVHKLKEKVGLFAEQKENAWNEGAFRIGKKWLGHGLKKVKESEIKHLVDESSILHRISRYRKPGMETDHWYKVLLKIWMMQHVVSGKTEEAILASHIVEPALPQELRDSYYEFQRRAKEYISSETASTLSLLPGSTSSDRVFITEITAPVNTIMRCLHRYGLTNNEGYGRTCHILILLDDDQIIDFFSGIVNRWVRWYHGCENFAQIKKIISDQVRMSCIRTLAAKYRIYEAEIEKRFDLQLSGIPSSEEIELELASTELLTSSQESNCDGALTYGLNYSGLCLVSLARKASESRPCYCFVVGCASKVSCVYALHVMERQKFPGWKSGFSGSIHPSLNRRRIGLCRKHLKDLFLGDISLQSINFGAWR